jgi:EAL domain-containing protein (putative c-di-GMP-specific phosphodiesterase class I)
VHSTIELAHNLGLRVVAEGVETQAVYELLVELGCDIIQGYFISEPVPVDEFNVLMSERADDHPPG